MENRVLRRIAKASAALIAVVILILGSSYVVWARGGLYSSTRHGDPTSGVRRDSALPRGDCGHCHSMHGAGGTTTDFALWTADNNQLCFTCHFGQSSNAIYRGSSVYEQSIHEDDSLMRWPGPEPPARMEPDAKGKCVNCHTPHGWGDSKGLMPTLLFKREEELCLGCHKVAGSAQEKIDTQMNYQYTHQMTNSQLEGRHHASEEIIPDSFSGQNRHNECADCHNSHVHTRDLHTQGSNRAGGVLRGSSFIEANYGSLPDTFPTFQPRGQIFDIQFEYQLCFKCHSYWAYGSFPPFAPSGGQQTDPSIEFNPNNVSSHNVIQAPNLNGIGVFVNGWRWDFQMVCTDCHGSSNANDPKGPHGSQLPFLVKARWDVTSGQRTQNTSSHLCFLCHDFTTYAQRNDNRNTGFSRNNFGENLHGLHANEDNPVANRPIGCMDCHSKVPHGINRRALLVTSSDPARLLGGTVLLKQSDVPNWGPSGNWDEGDCTVVCH